MIDDTNTSNEEPTLQPQPSSRRPHDIDALTPKEKKRLERDGQSLKRLREIERVIQPLVAIKVAQGSLHGTGQREEAARALGVSVWTIDRRIDAYRADPRVESFVSKRPGRDPGRMLSQDQQDIACYFFINPNLKTLYPDGSTDSVPQIADVKYIYKVIQKLATEPKWSIATLRRYLHDLKSENPLIIASAQKGGAYLRNKLLPARRNNVDRPNQRWQIDARPLPIYVKHDGMICTVTLLQILDDYSWYPVRHRITPRMVKDDGGLPKRADFTSGDVGILVASAIYYERVRPEDLYTDNGSQIVAIQEFLEDLTEANDTLIKMRNSIPGRPRGRGKIEKFLGLMDELLKDLPANLVGKEKDLAAVSAARKVDNMLTFENFSRLVDQYMHEVRKRPRNNREKQGRDTLWRSKPALPPPSIRRLKSLTPERRETYVSVNNWAIQFDNEEYEPRIENADDMYQWMLATARPEYVPLHAAKLDAGWVLEVCLDGVHWNECVLKSAQKLSADRYNELQNAAIRRIREESNELFARIQPTIKRVGADRIRKHVITKQPMLPEDQSLVTTSTPIDDASMMPSTVLQPPLQEHGRSPSLKSVKRKLASSNTPKKKVDKADVAWSDVPDMDEMMRALEQEIGGES